MRNRWLVFVILSTLVLCGLGAAVDQETKGSIRGYVFRDSNQNGVLDAGEEGIPGVYITISYGDYQHTYYSGEGDPGGNTPGPGSYGPTSIESGAWTVTVHVPDGYRSTTLTARTVDVPVGGTVTGVDFGLYGSGPITYSAGTGVAMESAAGLDILPQTGGTPESVQSQSIALLVALLGLLVLIGTPWCVVRVRHTHKRLW